MIPGLATPEDVPVLAAIHAQCFAEAWTGDAIAGLMMSPGSFALLDEAHTGFILVRVATGESEILTLGVTPAARRRGTASALVAAAAERAAEADASIMFLEVSVVNTPALALYKRLGFDQAGYRKAYYAVSHGVREDALVLKAAIPLPRVGFCLQLG